MLVPPLFQAVCIKGGALNVSFEVVNWGKRRERRRTRGQSGLEQVWEGIDLV